MKNASFIVLLSFWPVIARAEVAPAVCSDGKCIQVGSYNIEFLGGERAPFEGTPRGERSDAELQRIADRITEDLNLEVVVFEEINTHSDQWAKLKDKLKSRGYQFFEGTTSDRNQFVVLAWDADEVKLLDNSAQQLDVRDSFELGDNCTVPGKRKPLAARFKAGEFDFWVIGVHLKSRLGEEACSDKVRTEQCKDLVKKIDVLIHQSGERDVLIVGDFNSHVGHESLRPLADAGFIPQMKFLMRQSAKGSFIKSQQLNESTDLIDQVMLRYRDTREVVKNSACVMHLDSVAEASKYISEQSDHVPVWVSFRTDADLDGAK